MSDWRIEKSEVGNNYELRLGIAGTPFFKSVEGLTHRQAERIGQIIGDIEVRRRKNTQREICEALGITE